MIFRSVDVVLQNNTNELLTVEGFNTMRGEWGPPGAPRRGDVVEKQGSGKWVNQSKVDGIGAQGYLRLGCTKGYIEISWNMPGVDVAKFQAHVSTPAALDYRIHFNKENLDLVVVIVTIVPHTN